MLKWKVKFFYRSLYTWAGYSHFHDDLGLTFAGGRERPDGDLVLRVVLKVKYFLVRSLWVGDFRLENVAVNTASRYTADKSLTFLLQIIAINS